MLPLKNLDLLKTNAYINGKWIDHKARFSVHNPANNQELTQVVNLGAREATHAIDAADQALNEWQALPVKQRSALLKKWHDLILDNIDDLSLLLTLEQGKPLAEAKGEIRYGASYLEWFAEEAKRICGDIIPSPSSDQQILVTKQAVGLVTAITPWNFPSAMILRKAAPALAAGCTFVVKPAAETPLSALALAALAEQARIPAGVFNVITGTDSQSIGDVLTTHPRVRKFTFTGSTSIGKKLLTQCATTVKKTTMELGGNAPFIVFEDADIDAAVAGAMASKFRNAGQTCVSANRFLVHADVYDQFIKKITRQVALLKLDSGDKKEATIGPLIHSCATQRVHGLVTDAISQGAQLYMGGKISTLGECFYEPTILTNVTPSMTIFHHEVFGPVITVVRFHSEEEAVKLANNTEMGLAAYFYSKSMTRIFQVSKQLDFGMIGINEGVISNEMAPFGGIKQSGFGREGSKYGINDYIDIKYLCLSGV